jgi:hypothetical protein
MASGFQRPAKEARSERLAAGISPGSPDRAVGFAMKFQFPGLYAVRDYSAFRSYWITP